MNLETQFKSIIQSGEKYPVDFDRAWKWIGYSTKGNAKRVFLKNFIPTNDYRIIINDKRDNNPNPEQKIFITIEAFKEFCMVSETTTGRDVRRYFIDVEKKLIQLKEFSSAKTNIKLKESRKKNISLFAKAGLKNPEEYRFVTRRQTQIITGLTPTQLRESRNPSAKTGRELLTEREQIGMLIEENLTMLNILDNKPEDFSGVVDCIEKTVPEIKRLYYRNNEFVQELEELKA